MFVEGDESLDGSGGRRRKVEVGAWGCDVVHNDRVNGLHATLVQSVIDVIGGTKMGI